LPSAAEASRLRSKMCLDFARHERGFNLSGTHFSLIGYRVEA
jgi:hypothetical protein